MEEQQIIHITPPKHSGTFINSTTTPPVPKVLHQPTFVNSLIDGVPELEIRGLIHNYDAGWISNMLGSLKVGTADNSLPSKNVRLLVNSEGGYINAAYTIVSAITRFQNNGGEVEVFVEGLAASAAGWVTAAGTRGKRRAIQYARFVLHAPRTDTGVTVDQLSDSDPLKAELESVFVDLVNIFVATTGQSAETIRSLMASNAELSAEEAKEYGIIDEVVYVNNAPKFKNSLSTSDFINATSALDIMRTLPTRAPKTSNHMAFTKLTNALGLVTEASESSIETAVNKLIADKEATETKYSTLVNEHRTTLAQLDQVKADQKAKTEADATSHVDALIKQDPSLADNRQDLLNMALTNLESFKLLRPVQTQLVNAKIDDGIETQAQSGTKDLAEAKKFHNMHPDKRNELMNTDNTEFNRLSALREKHINELV